jgi:hypothetical protein
VQRQPVPSSGVTAAGQPQRLSSWTAAGQLEPQPCWTAVLDTNCAEASGLRAAHWPLLSPRCFPPAVHCPHAHGAQPVVVVPYRIDIPAAWRVRVFPEISVERLRPYLRRPDHLGGDDALHPADVRVGGAALRGEHAQCSTPLPTDLLDLYQQLHARGASESSRRSASNACSPTSVAPTTWAATMPYTRQTSESALRCAAGTLLDAATYGSAGFIPATATA